ncbi:UNVERIFIED_CONTAM: hypothetical protein HDU68_000451 [Siphonaria sp. JEL0065]|nr:hypothetical protein HDU68_000451 [Siphonaria sp. JEL0065]
MPRVCFDTLSDVEYVRKQVLLAALAGEAGSSAEAEEFVARMFRLAAPNMSVNGHVLDLDADASLPDEYEPFEETLRENNDALLSASASIRSRVAALRIKIGTSADVEAVSLTAKAQEKAKTNARSLAQKMYQTTASISQKTKDLANDYSFSKRTLEAGKATVETTEPQWKRARIVVGDFCSTDSSATATSFPPFMGTPMKSKAAQKDDSAAAELTPRKARAGLLKMIH